MWLTTTYKLSTHITNRLHLFQYIALMMVLLRSRDLPNTRLAVLENPWKSLNLVFRKSGSPGRTCIMQCGLFVDLSVWLCLCTCLLTSAGRLRFFACQRQVYYIFLHGLIDTFVSSAVCTQRLCILRLYRHYKNAVLLYYYVCLFCRLLGETSSPW